MHGALDRQAWSYFIILTQNHTEYKEIELEMKKQNSQIILECSQITFPLGPVNYVFFIHGGAIIAHQHFDQL